MRHSQSTLPSPWLLLLTWLWLHAGLLAAPRVALVIPLQGEVQLSGASLQAPTLAEEGQVLRLNSGAQVRLQLLGSNKETQLQGQQSYTVSRERLERDAQPLRRGAVALTTEIGNLSRAGGGTVRFDPKSSLRPVGVAFEWPPRREDGRWVSPAVGSMQVSPRRRVLVLVQDRSDPTQPELNVTLSEPVQSLVFPLESLRESHRYQVRVESEDGSQSYERSFTILSPDDQTALRQTASALRLRALESGEIPTLIRLASLYDSYDRPDKVVEVLGEAMNHPTFTTLDRTVQEQIAQAAERARWALDRTVAGPSQ